MINNHNYKNIKYNFLLEKKQKLSPIYIEMLIYFFILFYFFSNVIRFIYYFILQKKILRFKNKKDFDCKDFNAFISGNEIYKNLNVYSFSQIKVKNNKINGIGYEFFKNIEIKFLVKGFISKNSNNVYYIYYDKIYSKNINKSYFFTFLKKENILKGKSFQFNMLSWFVNYLHNHSLGNINNIKTFNTTTDNKCIICISNDIDFIPKFFCGHLGICNICNSKIEECPFCKCNILIYIS